MFAIAKNYSIANRPGIFFILAMLFTTAQFITMALVACAEDDDNSIPGIQVTTALAKSATWAISIPAQGEILPWEVAILSAKTNGVGATEVAVLEGDSVRKGQVLARFDDRLLRAEVAQAKANLALANANLDNANSNLKRMQQLKLKQVLSEQEYDSVATQAAAAEATRAQAAAALTLAEIKLADATVTAPDAGKVLERNLELGQVPQTGAVLFKLLHQNKIEWIAQIDAAELNRVKTGMAARITLADQTLLSGTIRSVSPQLSSGSRLAKVRILLDGAPELAVNTYVEGTVLIGSAPAIVVPANCLVIKDGKTWVFRVKNPAGNNTSAEQVLVSLGRRQQQEIELLSGINAGDTLVLEGAGFLNDGDKIAVKKSGVASAANAGATP
ncbi:MAG TPA: efflux RND transporter periplasmic adaptor subunit [Cellvibrio sp.]|nr:efflux RND transporter periplasmic adaptor subunit [Cellvibrio sp.]